MGSYKILKHVENVVYNSEFPNELAHFNPVFNVSIHKNCICYLVAIIPIESLRIDDRLYYEEFSVEI